MESYDLESAVSATYSHWLYEFCDVYLELSKPRLACLFSQASVPEQSKATLNVMFRVMDRGLRLLHPMIPFITEELWQTLMRVQKAQNTGAHNQKSVSLAPYPLYIPSWDDPVVEEQQTLFMRMVRHLRSTLAQFDVSPKVKLDGYLQTTCATTADLLRSLAEDVTTLAKVRSVSVVSQFPTGLVTSLVNDEIASGLDPQNAIEFSAVEKKFSKRLAELQLQIEKIGKKRALADYEAKVPKEVQQRDSDALSSYETEHSSLKEALEMTRKFLPLSSSSS